MIAALVAVHLVTLGWVPPSGPLLLTLAGGSLIWIVLFQAFGLYGWNGLGRSSVSEEVRGIVSATSLGVLVVSILGAWWGQPVTRTSLTMMLLVSLSLELSIRWLVRSSVRRRTREGRLTVRTLVVGADDEADGLARHLASPGGWFTPVGSVALNGGTNGSSAPGGIPSVGHIDELEEAIDESGADCVFVASTGVGREDLLTIARACRRADAELRLTTNVSDALTNRLSVQSVGGVTSIAFKPVRLTRTQAALKRGLDLVLASLALVVVLLPLAVMAAAIKLTSRGPVLFRQERVTKGGRRFTMYKLRTMAADPQRALEGKVIDLTRPFFKMEDDPRLTRVGRVLRTYSLDELPQLWN
ncbi:MAG: sugar transferase, partial [Gemmatimonadota bacterium]